jgi:phenylalanine-4-hydroxylase
MEQLYNQYTAEQQQVWNILFTRQVQNLQDKVASVYLSALTAMQDVLNADHIPQITALNEVLLRRNGWSIHIVPGLIPVNDFFALLAEKKFCSSTWLRTMAQLDYLEEPDMFHDIFGHIPLFWEKDYAAMMHQIGMLGVKYADYPEAVAMLERFYWFTIEFGLVKHANLQTNIYGAGIISSFGESNSIYQSAANIRPFDLTAVLYHDFVKNELQNLYYEIESLEALYAILPSLDAILKEECERPKAIPLTAQKIVE